MAPKTKKTMERCFSSLTAFTLISLNIHRSFHFNTFLEGILTKNKPLEIWSQTNVFTLHSADVPAGPLVEAYETLFFLYRLEISMRAFLINPCDVVLHIGVQTFSLEFLFSFFCFCVFGQNYKMWLHRIKHNNKQSFYFYCKVLRIRGESIDLGIDNIKTHVSEFMRLSKFLR